MRGARTLAMVVITLAVVVTLAVWSGPTGVRAELVAPGKAAPELAAGAWVNSQPLTLHGLRGRVVLVDFWTFG